jgi:CheY-like chemotaxis protein
MSAPHVLVVDDDPTNRSVVGAFLGPTGVVIHFATNGLEAVEAFKATAFDVVLMDVQMPVMDGLAAIREIRAYEARNGSSRARIHVLSAHGFAQDIQASLAAGADSHLTKPLSLAEVVAAVFGGDLGGMGLRRPGAR